MLRLPSAFESTWDVSRALYHQAIWGGGRESGVWIPQFASLRNHVREISRTPSSARVEGLSRQLSRWSDKTELAASLPPREAASLFDSSLQEASSLLELGYPRAEGLDFVSRFPPPGHNSRRTTQQMRAALHHLGGDFTVFKSMLRSPDRFDPRLKVVFSVWPVQRTDRGREFIHLSYPGQRIPAVISFSTELRGYCLLALFDLSQRLRYSEGIGMLEENFSDFVSSVGEESES